MVYWVGDFFLWGSSVSVLSGKRKLISGNSIKIWHNILNTKIPGGMYVYCRGIYFTKKKGLDLCCLAKRITFLCHQHRQIPVQCTSKKNLKLHNQTLVKSSLGFTFTRTTICPLLFSFQDLELSCILFWNICVRSGPPYSVTFRPFNSCCKWQNCCKKEKKCLFILLIPPAKATVSTKRYSGAEKVMFCSI